MQVNGKSHFQSPFLKMELKSRSAFENAALGLMQGCPRDSLQLHPAYAAPLSKTPVLSEVHPHAVYSMGQGPAGVGTMCSTCLRLGHECCVYRMRRGARECFHGPDPACRASHMPFIWSTGPDEFDISGLTDKLYVWSSWLLHQFTVDNPTGCVVALL